MDTNTTPTAQQLLSQSQLFSAMSQEEIAELLHSVTRKRVLPGELIFRYGELGEELFVVASGCIELSVKDTTGERIPLTRLGPGELFGELSVLDHGPRSATAEATEGSVLLVLSRQHLSQFLTSHPGAAMELIGVLSHRLRSTDRLLMSRVARNLNNEIQHELSIFQKGASWIADFSGSIPFLFLNLAFFTIWIVINVELFPVVEAFDPYPFGFLTMAVSLEAIFLSIIVLLAQNLLATKEKIRGDIEYEVNLKAELEISELHSKVDQLHSEVLRAIKEGVSQKK